MVNRFGPLIALSLPDLGRMRTFQLQDLMLRTVSYCGAHHVD